MHSRMQIIATSAAVGAVVVSLGACSRGSGSAASGSSHATVASGSKSAVMIMSTLNNPFFVSVKNGAAAEAPKKGIKLDVENANNSDSTALNLATSALTKQPGILIIDPVGSQSATASVTSANSANVPVMAFDRKPEGGDLATFVGYDAIQAGRNAADALAKGLGDKGTIVEIQGLLGTNVAQDRSKGFEEEMAAKHPNIKTVAKQAADFDRAKALDVMTNILQAHPDINGVYAANDEMAMGVLAALKSRSLDGKVVLVGNDGISDALAAIAAGKMYATNAESPYALGQKVSDLAADVIGGKSVEKNTTLEGQLVTKDNVKEYAQHLVSIGDAADAPTNLK
ncbi:sugar ABC transporter substrate-binding protein [Jatrophihabitans lederbergiae]|uniref:Substrate-binding domain-containing protein n=1 Tax=Jatrophihabitans lederbergiae TaxID=3075547 RepID=A0ABU2JEF6_9ACTN|nr:substrate-binding domain-containing protein [Jatrophihabitans sp. DSM 44399]MDT0263367.1 substrate-binding domain-containing protein [Jatrophihabitans sp. DSM 44399]